MILRIFSSSTVTKCFTIALLFLSSCTGNSRFVHIEGQIKGARNTQIYLREAAHDRINTIDSTRTDSRGNFEFKFSNSNGPRFVMLAVKQEPEPLLLLVDDSEKIEVSGVIGNPISSYTLNGSEGTSLVQGLNARLKGAVQTIDSLSKHFRNSREHIKFDSISTAIDSLYLKTISDHKQYTVNFIHKNRYSLASILALYQQYDKNSPVLAKREDFELFKLVDSTLYPLYPHNSLVENLHKNVGMIGKQFSLFDRRRDMLTEGQTLPDIDLPMLDGDTLKLSQIKGKLILIDFWALWCNDCQANNRKLMDIYSRFSGKGFQVVQVSLDLKTADLPAKIKNLGIEWPIVADFQQWDSPILEAMSINSIPSNYLIDSKRVIKAQNINPKELEEVLGKLLP